MGNRLFGVDIGRLVAKNIGPGVLPVTIEKKQFGTRDPEKLTGGKQALPPLVFEGARGWWEDFTGNPPPGVTILSDDRKAIVLGDTIPAGAMPERGTLLTIEGIQQKVIRKISRDPAAAVFVFQCRDINGPDGE